MILHHIHHKMPIYKDCTLGELLFVGGTVLIVLGLGLSFLTKILFGFASIGLAITLLVLVHVTRFLLAQLQKIKYGKPHGYYQQLFLKHLQQQIILSSVLPSKYIQRRGKWSVRRKW